ncbi:hypothetical protein SNEBB_008345 [Seison nebaliae]|nr:hypothetical protein SNEBB_008345 [Seison nebaliae]
MKNYDDEDSDDIGNTKQMEQMINIMNEIIFEYENRLKLKEEMTDMYRYQYNDLLSLHSQAIFDVREQSKLKNAFFEENLTKRCKIDKMAVRIDELENRLGKNEKNDELSEHNDSDELKEDDDCYYSCRSSSRTSEISQIISFKSKELMENAAQDKRETIGTISRVNSEEKEDEKKISNKIQFFNYLTSQNIEKNISNKITTPSTITTRINTSHIRKKEDCLYHQFRFGLTSISSWCCECLRPAHSMSYIRICVNCYLTLHESCWKRLRKTNRVNIPFQYDLLSNHLIHTELSLIKNGRDILESNSFVHLKNIKFIYDVFIDLTDKFIIYLGTDTGLYQLINDQNRLSFKCLLDSSLIYQIIYCKEIDCFFFINSSKRKWKMVCGESLRDSTISPEFISSSLDLLEKILKIKYFIRSNNNFLVALSREDSLELYDLKLSKEKLFEFNHLTSIELRKELIDFSFIDVSIEDKENENEFKVVMATESSVDIWTEKTGTKIFFRNDEHQIIQMKIMEESNKYILYLFHSFSVMKLQINLNNSSDVTKLETIQFHQPVSLIHQLNDSNEYLLVNLRSVSVHQLFNTNNQSKEERILHVFNGFNGRRNDLVHVDHQHQFAIVYTQINDNNINGKLLILNLRKG